MPLLQHPRRCAAAVAVVVLVLVSALGALTHHDAKLALPPAKAEHLAAASPKVAREIRGADAVEVLRVDDRLVKVVWYRGSRLLVWVGVHANGRVEPPARNDDHRIGYGTPLSHAPVLLAGLTLLFLLATLRSPLRSARTLDALALAGFLVPTVLLDWSVMEAGQLLAAALLLWLMARGVVVAWRGPAAGDAAHPTLLDRAAARLSTPRMPAQLAGALVVVALLMTLTSTGIIDVGPANMEGATLLLHGTLPYGHMPGDVVHGDTYGLPIYALYAPFAVFWPMRDSWDEATGALVLGAVALLVVAAGFVRIAEGRPWAALTALLASPAFLMSVSSGTNDILVGAALVWAFAWFRRPAASSAVLMLAGLAKVAPMAIVPLWLARLRGAELRRAIVGCAVSGAVVLAALVAIGGLHGPLDMLRAMAFQLGRESEMSVWSRGVPRVPLQPIVQGAVLATALGGAVLVALDRAVAADPRRVAGLVTAVLAGLQLAANHWMPLYLLWLVPPAMVALLGPLGATATAAVPSSSSVPAGRPSRAECPSSATPSWAR